MLLAACFAFMWLVALYQMWFGVAPLAVSGRDSGDV
jgi:hypothetical protein